MRAKAKLSKKKEKRAKVRRIGVIVGVVMGILLLIVVVCLLVVFRSASDGAGEEDDIDEKAKGKRKVKRIRTSEKTAAHKKWPKRIGGDRLYYLGKGFETGLADVESVEEENWPLHEEFFGMEPAEGAPTVVGSSSSGGPTRWRGNFRIKDLDPSGHLAQLGFRVNDVFRVINLKKLPQDLHEALYERTKHVRENILAEMERAEADDISAEHVRDRISTKMSKANGWEPVSEDISRHSSSDKSDRMYAIERTLLLHTCYRTDSPTRSENDGEESRDIVSGDLRTKENDGANPEDTVSAATGATHDFPAESSWIDESGSQRFTLGSIEEEDVWTMNIDLTFLETLSRYIFQQRPSAALKILNPGGRLEKDIFLIRNEWTTLHSHAWSSLPLGCTADWAGRLGKTNVCSTRIPEETFLDMALTENFHDDEEDEEVTDLAEKGVTIPAIVVITYLRSYIHFFSSLPHAIYCVFHE